MSEIRTLKASDENSGLRLDAFIPKADDTISRNFAQILISQGAVTVNGAPELSKKKKALQRNFGVEITPDDLERIYQELTEYEQKNS